jgi:copper(I)-binding protein
MMKSRIFIAPLALGLLSAAASAHVVLDVPQAPVGKAYKATLLVTHGCKGAATTKLSVEIPAGVVGVKPQQKPGWKIDIVRGPYDHPVALMHGAATEGVKTITWSGGTLADDVYDEFAFRGSLDKSLTAGTTLYFPVVQTCGSDEQRWIEIPAAGQELHSLAHPAAALTLLAASDVTPSSPIVLDHPWSRATPAGAKVAAGYLTIVNHGSAADVLTGVSTDIAGQADVHEMSMANGVMSMRPVTGGLPIPAGGQVTLKPGAFHLMFQDLKRPLKEGDRFTGTLMFQKAGPMPVTFDVGAIAAMGPSKAEPPAMGGMDHDHMKMDH